MTWYGGDGREESSECFLPGGDRFLATRTRDAERMPVVYDAGTGEGEEFDRPGGVATLTSDDPLADGRVLVRHTTPTRWPELLA